MEDITTNEYELRHTNGEVDEFNDIVDALDYQARFFPHLPVFERTVTTTIVRGEWVKVFG